jgi:hypothetical protein
MFISAVTTNKCFRSFRWYYRTKKEELQIILKNKQAQLLSAEPRSVPAHVPFTSPMPLPPRHENAEGLGTAIERIHDEWKESVCISCHPLTGLQVLRSVFKLRNSTIRTVGHETAPVLLIVLLFAS